MSTLFANTTPEQASADFWGWMGPKMDDWSREQADLIATMPERDESSRTILGEEALEIEFEPVTQAPARPHCCVSGV